LSLERLATTLSVLTELNKHLAEADGMAEQDFT